MPKHTVRVRDRFKLGKWEWIVKDVEGSFFWSYTRPMPADDTVDMVWPLLRAEMLNWIEPAVTFTKAQVEAIKERLEPSYYTDSGIKTFHSWLDEHTEK